MFDLNQFIISLVNSGYVLSGLHYFRLFEQHIRFDYFDV